MVGIIVPEEKVVQFYLRANGINIDSDMLSMKATIDMVNQAVNHLVHDMIDANKQAADIISAIENGQTIEIENPESGASMVFQIPQKDKEIVH
jgi:hypothetical protein